jgi:hypothetical protein
MFAPSLTVAPKRRWLTFSLRTFLVVTLALSLVLGYFGRAWLQAYRDRQPPTLRELAQIARRHGIPMPPQDAQLVQAKGGEQRVDNRGIWHLYAPAFLVLPASDEQVVVLRGGHATLRRLFSRSRTCNGRALRC